MKLILKMIKKKNNEKEEDENSEEEINKVKNDILNVDDD